MFEKKICFDCEDEMEPLTTKQPIELACTHEICIRCALK